MSALNLSSYLLIFGLLVVCGWTVDHQVQKSQYLQLKNDYQQLVVNAEIAANEKEYEWKNQYEAAANATAEREKLLQTDIANLSSANGRLHDTIGKLRSSVSTNTTETNRAIADAAAELLGACAAEYQSVATEADRRASEAMRLSESWPR